MNYGIVIRLLCARKGISQRELSRQSGINATTISLLSQNKIDFRISTFEKLSEFFEIPLSEMFKMVESENDDS